MKIYWGPAPKPPTKKGSTTSPHGSKMGCVHVRLGKKKGYELQYMHQKRHTILNRKATGKGCWCGAYKPHPL